MGTDSAFATVASTGPEPTGVVVSPAVGVDVDANVASGSSPRGIVIGASRASVSSAVSAGRGVAATTTATAATTATHATAGASNRRGTPERRMRCSTSSYERAAPPPAIES